MEMRERNTEFGMPSSIGNYVPASQPIQVSSSSRLPNTQPLIDHHHLLLPQHHRIHHQDLELQLQESNRVRRDQNPDPDPAPLANNPSISQTAAQQQPQTASATSAAAAAADGSTAQYRECLKNHAANMGAHVVDGCGEFMPGGEVGTVEALKCAACECHRNFHRREIEGEPPQPPPNCYYAQNPARNNARRNTINTAQPTLPSPVPAAHQQQQKFHHGFAAFANSPSKGFTSPIMMAFGGTSRAPAESSSEDLNVFQANAGGQMMGQQSRKRFRTKFNQEQKDRMQEFAEKLGWRIQKQDEQEVQQFCNTNGVKRQVFKVWMHNNKQAMKKKQL